MATFSVMNIRNQTVPVEADKFVEEGSLVVFRDGSGEQVYALPTAQVKTIARAGA